MLSNVFRKIYIKLFPSDPFRHLKPCMSTGNPDNAGKERTLRELSCSHWLFCKTR